MLAGTGTLAVTRQLKKCELLYLRFYCSRRLEDGAALLQRNQETYSLSEANAAAVNKRSALIAAVKTALDFQKGELNPGEKHEVVVCVFDRDEHALFDKACSLAKANKLRTARSWLWSAKAHNSNAVARCRHGCGWYRVSTAQAIERAWAASPIKATASCEFC